VGTILSAVTASEDDAEKRYSGKAASPAEKPYSGILLKPFVDKGDFSSLAELGPKLFALFDHFGVEQGDYCKLALELAGRHVPGFAFQHRAGPREQWIPLRRVVLVAQVRQHQAGKTGRAGSVIAACRKLTKMFNSTEETLRRQYYNKDEKCDRMADVLVKLAELDRGGHMVGVWGPIAKGEPS
jgi:hypothetical protein